jgi:hypothetical protein
MSSMSNFHGKSSFSFVASVAVAALMTGAVSAQTAEPPAGANAPAAPVAKPRKVTPSVIVVITNSRAIALTELVATPSGGTPKAIVANLAPRKNISVSVATARSCVFTLRAAYADGASAELTNINLCKDKTVNLIE